MAAKNMNQSSPPSFFYYFQYNTVQELMNDPKKGFRVHKDVISIEQRTRIEREGISFNLVQAWE
jgi:hypothetical protein